MKWFKLEVDFSIKDPSLIDEIGPEKIIIIRNPNVGLNAVLVIDNSVYGIPAGGLRLAPDITLDEMIRLARAMSMKFCTYLLAYSKSSKIHQIFVYHIIFHLSLFVWLYTYILEKEKIHY